MKIYEKHILQVYFVSFIKTLLFIASIVIAIKTLGIAQDLTEDSTVSLNDIALIAFHISPYILYTITPFALTIASFSVFYKLLTYSEIITLQNAGITNFQIIRPHFYITGICTILMLYSSAIIIPKTVKIRKNLQEAVIKRKIENFLTPNVTKEIKDITIITSQYDSDKQIALTLIHKPTKNGETVLIGNIKQSWEKNGMIGLITENATVLNVANNSQKIFKFEVLETQINPFADFQEQARLKHLTSFEILKLYFKAPQNQYISIINSRIMPSISATLLPFALIILLINFYNNRNRYSIKSIIIIIITIFYILFSCYNLSSVFSSANNFYILYVNIILTFLSLYFFSKTQKKFFKKNVNNIAN